MAIEEVSTRANLEDAAGNKSTVQHITQFDFQGSLNDAISAFGEEAVYTAYKANAKVQLQNIIRSMLEEGKSADEINAYVSTWTVGSKPERTRRSAEEVFLEKFRSASPEEKAAKLAELQALLNA